MGKIVKTIGGALGIGGKGGPGPVLNKSPFDISKESQEYKQYFDQQRAESQARQQAAQTPQLIEALRKQALGQGPSLAEAQLKSATNRNLAQQLSLAASMRGRSPAATGRQIVQQQGQAGRELAGQAAEAGLQERAQAQQLLAGQVNQADTLGAQSGQTGFNIAVAPKTALQSYETNRFNADVAKTNANKQQQTAILGGLLGAAGTVGGAALGKYKGGRVVPKMFEGGRAPIPSQKVETQKPKTPQQMGLLEVLVDSLKGYDQKRGVNTEVVLKKKAMGGRADDGCYEDGGRVPGEPKVEHNSLKNDVVHAVLSPDEIVIPISHSRDPKKATKFVEHLFANEGYFNPAMKSDYSAVSKARKKEKV